MSTKKITLDIIRKDGVHPVYIQVAQCLRKQLVLGNMANSKGEMPAYRRLAEEFGVSICVIQKAMRLLRKESLIKTYQGKVGRVLEKNAPKDTTMLKLAMIHPFSTGVNTYAAYLQQCMEKLGWEAMITIQESNNDPVQERAIAEKLAYNNFDAILLSPENSFANAEFFEQLSKKIPVMLLDQPLPNVNLPATIVDYAGGGKSIGQELVRRNCKKVVALIDENSNTSVNNMIRSMEEYLPVVRFEFPLFNTEVQRRKYDFSDWNIWLKRLIELLRNDPDIDVVFSPFDAMIEQMYISDVPESLRKNRYTVAVRDEMYMMHSQKYLHSNLLEWRYDRCWNLIYTALERLVKWRKTRIRPVGIKRIKMNLKLKCRRLK